MRKPTINVSFLLVLILTVDVRADEPPSQQVDEGNLNVYGVSQYLDDVPTTGLLVGIYRNRDDALKRVGELMRKPNVVKVEVDGFDNARSVSLSKDRAGNNSLLRLHGWHGPALGNQKERDRQALLKWARDTGLQVRVAPDSLKVGESFPPGLERNTVGAPNFIVKRGSEEFKNLVENRNEDIMFKDEEKTGKDADHMMTAELNHRVNQLAELVGKEWPGLKLRVIEAWDEDMEHGDQKKPRNERRSTHYEARAIDFTTSDKDPKKLARLAGLAIESGFDWVLHENSLHVHVHASVNAAP